MGEGKKSQLLLEADGTVGWLFPQKETLDLHFIGFLLVFLLTGLESYIPK